MATPRAEAPRGSSNAGPGSSLTLDPSSTTHSFLHEDPTSPGSRASLSSAPSSPLPGGLLAKLEGLLAAKAEEIQLAGRLGESLLGQQAELEERIKNLSDAERQSLSTNGPRRASRGSSLVGNSVVREEDSEGEREVGVETRQKLTELEEELKRWDQTNSGLYHTVGMAAAQGIPSLDAMANGEEATQFSGASTPNGIIRKTTSNRDLNGSNLVSGDDASGSAAASRRQRNHAQHRTNDIEFATEIGTGLLTEVRRLTKLLGDATEQLKDSQEEKHLVQKNLDSATAARRTVEESVEKYKEENWNLELATQELRTNYSESQSSLQKADAERTRFAKDLSSTREVLDTQRSEAEKLAAQLEVLKARHETDMATMRKNNAGLQREKSDLQTSIDVLKTELATSNRGIKRSGSNFEVEHMGQGAHETAQDSDEEGEEAFKAGYTGGRRKTGDLPVPFSEGDSFGTMEQYSADGSPRTSAVPSDIESLKSALAHSQKTISTLRSSLAREKTAKMELRRQLGDTDAWDDDGDSSNAGTPAKRSALQVARGSARGRGVSGRKRGGGIGVPSRLAHNFAGDNSIEEIDDDDEDDEHPDTFEDPTGSIFEHQFPHDDDVSETGTEGGFDSPLRSFQRRSTEIDRDFPERSRALDFSDDESLSHSSPYAQRSLRPESMHSIKGTRPTSAMFSGISPPAVSAAPVKVWVDQATMTDFADATIPVSHAGIQVTPAAIPIIVTSDFGGQTEPQAVIAKKESSTSTDPLPVLIDSTTSTDAPKVSEMQIQTDPTPIHSAGSMEDRALSGGNDATVTSLEGLIMGLRPHHSTESESEWEAGKPLGTETEFEDARESIGVTTPTMSTAGFEGAPNPSYGQNGYSRAGSEGSWSGDQRGTPQRLKANGRAPFTRTSTNAAPEVVEMGVQTDEWKPTPIYLEHPVVAAVQKRDSINTFGRASSPDQLIEVSAAAASAFLGHKTTASVDNASLPAAIADPSLGRSVDTIVEDKGKGPALMPPPLKGPRSSLRTSIAPPRPTSPPPADLLWRAQTPVADQDRDRKYLSASAPRPSSARPPSLRKQASVNMSEYKRRQQSSAVSFSGMSIHSDASHRLSMASSRTSDGGFDNLGGMGSEATDPGVIHAITQTMIGEFLYKYTRKAIGKGISEKRHRRYFWVHPYTKTLYWSSADPGGIQSTNQSSAKSVFIEGVRQVIDPNPFPPGLHSGSIVIKTPNREMKFTAPTRERHDMWFNAITYLLARPDIIAEPASSLSAPSPSILRQRSVGDGVFQTPNTTTAGTRTSQVYALGSPTDARPKSRSKLSTSTYKRSGTAALEYERASSFGSPRSLRTFNDVIGGPDDDDDLDIINKSEIPDDLMADEDVWEGLENVRACCDGKHDVGSLSRKHVHNHPLPDLPPNMPPIPPRHRSKSTSNSQYSRRKAVPSMPSSRKSSISSFVTTPSFRTTTMGGSQGINTAR